MHLPIRRVSQMVKALKERGLLTWSHDRDGSEGTYVTITESGKSYWQKRKKHCRDSMVRLLKSLEGKI